MCRLSSALDTARTFAGFLGGGGGVLPGTNNVFGLVLKSEGRD